MIARGRGHRRAEAQPFGARRGQRAKHVHRGTDAEGGEMVLGQPHRVEAAAIHELDTLERARIDLFQRPVPAGPTEELQHAHLHGHSALIPAALTMFPSHRHCLASVESDQADRCHPERSERSLGRRKGPPRLTNEVQHQTKVLLWANFMTTSPSTSAARWPSFAKPANRSAKSRQLWIARHRASLVS